MSRVGVLVNLSEKDAKWRKVIQAANIKPE
jgi:hypothetical protein